ncbi:hypothetical protein AMTRI_Chr08g168550 [Amborella trichopoda]
MRFVRLLVELLHLLGVNFRSVLLMREFTGGWRIIVNVKITIHFLCIEHSTFRLDSLTFLNRAAGLLDQARVQIDIMALEAAGPGRVWPKH